jgi:hypothetical protein
MKIDLTQTSPMIDAADLAKTFGLDTSKIKILMQNGAITSRYEVGADEDAGSHRLTFWYADTRVRFTCDASGTVLKTSRIKGERRS